MSQERKKSVVIKLEPETGIQVHWWILNLRALRQMGGEIKDPKNHLPVRALDLHGRLYEEWGVAERHLA